MGTMASQITKLMIVYSAVYSGADQRKHQSSASLDFVRGIHRWPVNSPHKWPVTRKIFPFDDVIMALLTVVSVSLVAIHFVVCVKWWLTVPYSSLVLHPHDRVRSITYAKALRKRISIKHTCFTLKHVLNACLYQRLLSNILSTNFTVLMECAGNGRKVSCSHMLCFTLIYVDRDIDKLL